jgi:hypothetical protein
MAVELPQMKRTTIMLPYQLKAKAEREARRTGVSLGEFIRASMQLRLDQEPKGKKRRFFPDDFTFTDDGPPDLVANLDKYLDQLHEEDDRRIHAYAAKPKSKSGRKQRAG